MGKAIGTTSGITLKHADFESLTDALDYASRGATGLTFHAPGTGVVHMLSYAELRRQARAMAGALLKKFRKNEHIGLVAETSPDFFIAFMACQYAGLIPATMSLPPAFGGRDHFSQQARRMAGAATLSAILVPQDLKSFYENIFSGEPVGILPLEAGGWPAAPEAALEARRPDDICYIQFSSGSTSEPKGIVATQASVSANCRGIVRDGLAVKPGDRAVSWLPLYHDMGLVGFFIAPMMSQMSVDYMKTSDFVRRPMSWLKLINAHGGTISYSPSFGYELCVRRYRDEELDLSNWRVAGIGGDMVRHSVLTSFGETFAPSGFDPSAFVASYGLAEATLAVSFAPLGQGLTSDDVDAVALRFADRVRSAAPNAAARKVRTFVKCGTPLPGHDVQICKDTAANLPDRVIGRIRVRGASVAAGYYRGGSEMEPLTEADGWLDTGDLGYWKDGQIVVTGRLKDLILWNGRNIWPQDVEWAVQEAGDGLIGRCVVIDVPGADATDRIVLLAECRRLEEANREQLRASLAQAARQATGAPVEVIFVAPRTLPVTSSGKLSRSAARMKLMDDAFEMAGQPA